MDFIGQTTDNVISEETAQLFFFFPVAQNDIFVA